MTLINAFNEYSNWKKLKLINFFQNVLLSVKLLVTFVIISQGRNPHGNHKKGSVNEQIKPLSQEFVIMKKKRK